MVLTLLKSLFLLLLSLPLSLSVSPLPGLPTFRIYHLVNLRTAISPTGWAHWLPRCRDPGLPSAGSSARNGQMHCVMFIPNINCDHSPRIECWRKKG